VAQLFASRQIKTARRALAHTEQVNWGDLPIANAESNKTCNPPKKDHIAHRGILSVTACLRHSCECGSSTQSSRSQIRSGPTVSRLRALHCLLVVAVAVLHFWRILPDGGRKWHRLLWAAHRL
jgi:hypothetical protein